MVGKIAEVGPLLSGRECYLHANTTVSRPSYNAEYKKLLPAVSLRKCTELVAVVVTGNNL